MDVAIINSGDEKTRLNSLYLCLNEADIGLKIYDTFLNVLIALYSLPMETQRERDGAMDMTGRGESFDKMVKESLCMFSVLLQYTLQMHRLGIFT